MALVQMNSEIIQCIMRFCDAPRIGMVNKEFVRLWKGICLDIPVSALLDPLLTHIKAPKRIECGIDFDLPRIMKAVMSRHIIECVKKTDIMTHSMIMGGFVIDVVSVYNCMSQHKEFSKKASAVAFSDDMLKDAFKVCLDRKSYTPTLLRSDAVKTIASQLRDRVLIKNAEGKHVFTSSAREVRIRQNVDKYELNTRSTYLTNFIENVRKVFPALAWNVSLILVIDGAIQFEAKTGRTLFNVKEIEGWLIKGSLSNELTDDEKTLVKMASDKISSYEIDESIGSPYGFDAYAFQCHCNRLLKSVICPGIGMADYSPVSLDFSIGPFPK